MSRPAAHEWGDKPPPTGPRARPKKRRADACVADVSEHWVRPESQSYRPNRSPSPKRHKPEPPSDDEASPPRYGNAFNGIAIRGKGSVAGAHRRSPEEEDDEDRVPPAQLGDYQVCRQSSDSMEEGPPSGGKLGSSDFQEKMPFPDYFPQAAPWVMDRVRQEFRKLWEFLELPNLRPVRSTWHPLVTGTLSELERIESFCDYINAKRRELHGQTLDYRRQIGKVEKDYRAQIDDMEGFKRSIARLETETETYKKQVSKLEMEAEGYKKQLSKLEKDNKKQIADVEGYENQVTKLEEDNRKLAAEMDGYKKQVSELEKDKKNLALEPKDGQLQVHESEGTRIPVIVLEDCRLKAPKGPKDWSLETEDQTPKGPAKDQSMEMEGYKTQIRKLEEICRSQAAQMKGFQMEITRWQQDFQNQGVQTDTFSSEVGRLQQEIGRLQQELDSVIAHRNRRGETIRHLEDKLASMATKKDPRVELFRVRKEKEKLLSDYDALKAKYEAHLTNFRNLERDTMEQKKKFTTIRVEHQRSIDKIKAEKQELERQILEGQKTPNPDSQQSPADSETSAPDIYQLMGGFEPMMPPADTFKQPGKTLARSEECPDVDYLMTGAEPATSPDNSSVPPEENQATTPTTGTGAVSRLVPPNQSKDGQVQGVQDSIQNKNQGNTRCRTEHDRGEIMKLQVMLREKDERLKQLTTEKNNLQSLLDEKVTQIQKQLQAEKNRLQQQAQGFDDKSGSATINAILKTRVDKLLLKDKEKDTGLKQLKDANFRLECLVEEKEAKFDQLVAVNVSLEGMVQEKTAIIQKLEDERNQLQVDLQTKLGQIHALKVKVNETENQIREEAERTAKLRQIMAHKEAEISTLRAASSLPNTPLSAVSSGSFRNQIPQATPEEGTHLNNDSGLSAQRESAVFIKRERPDPGCETPAVAQETAGQDERLRKGIVFLLGNIFDIKPGQDNDATVRYISHLGTGPGNTTGPGHANANVSPINDAWKLKNVWGQDVITTQSHLQNTTLVGRFVYLSLLVSSVQEGQKNDMGTCQLIGELALDLLSAKHSQLPLAGMAFLDCMTRSRPTARPERVKAREGLMAILICELCRYLQRVFPKVPQNRWGIREVLGKTEDEAPETSPIWKLAAILAEEDTRSDPLEMRKRLAQTCGDKFSFFYQTDENEKEREVGLLSCGNGTEDDANSQIFLMLDFEQRWIRLVDCGLAYFTSNRAAPRMLDLVIAREDAEKKEEVELFKIEAAPKDVAAFWLKHICYGG
ncbi:putative myosin-2 heavy chain [Triangularia setosa]|uniref:Myosin-2 heavy chain n=1 Tax=Triangularia setosa TaxID=2587417 RepID=A0AAN7A4N8_9PEZI|nr:putative myosin-2 heavy chain [Podospora setosa]